VTVKRIIERRKQSRIRSMDDLGKVGVRLSKAREYVTF